METPKERLERQITYKIEVLKQEIEAHEAKIAVLQRNLKALQMGNDIGKPLTTLGLSKQTYNALLRAPLPLTVEGIAAIVFSDDYDWLLSVRNFGEKRLEELRTKLTEHGFNPIQ